MCKKLSELKAKVIAVTRSPDNLNALKKECPSIQGINVDLKSWSQTKAALYSVPQLDGLVNNAGIAIIKPFADLSEEDFDEFVIT